MADRSPTRLALAFAALALGFGVAPSSSTAAVKHHHVHHAAHAPITDATNTDDEGCTAADGGHAICFQ